MIIQSTIIFIKASRMLCHSKFEFLSKYTQVLRDLCCYWVGNHILLMLFSRLVLSGWRNLLPQLGLDIHSISWRYSKLFRRQ
jgi:hypothetical protein